MGDHRQLGAVEAGGLFRLLVTDTEAAELSGVRRFHAEWEREASLRLRDGDKTVVEQYLQRGRVVGGERAVMVEEAFVRWQLTRARGESVVVCAADHATVDELSMRARAARVGAGEVEADGVVAGNQLVGVGDEIVTTRNDRRLVTSRGGWVRNGDRWQVLARSGDDRLLVEDLGGRGRVELPGDYVRDEVALAYAVTIHKAQGLTMDRSILLVDERTTAEGLYVGMTRGRSSNVALATCDDAGAEHGQPGSLRSESEVVLAAMGRSAAEVAALEALREAFARSESLATLAPRLANLDAWITKEMPPDRSRELGWASDGLDHARRHCRPGHLTRAGREDRRRLEAAEAATPRCPQHRDAERAGSPTTPTRSPTGRSSRSPWPSAATSSGSELPSPSPITWWRSSGRCRPTTLGRPSAGSTPPLGSRLTERSGPWRPRGCESGPGMPARSGRGTLPFAPPSCSPDRCPDGAWSGAWITGWSSGGEQVGQPEARWRASTPWCSPVMPGPVKGSLRRPVGRP